MRAVGTAHSGVHDGLQMPTAPPQAYRHVPDEGEEGGVSELCIEVERGGEDAKDDEKI